MKFIILKENLYKGLNIVSRVVGKNLTLPILNNIFISAQKNFLNLSSTDLELGIKYWTLIKTEKEGEITVPAKLLLNFVNLLPDRKINIESKNQELFIECEEYNTKIKGLPAQDFPIIPTIEENYVIELNIPSFCEGLTQVVDFSTVNQIRPELSGIYFNFQNNRLQLAATDSFRLAEKTLILENSIDKQISFILPQKSVKEIINIFSELTGKIKLYYSPNQVLFECMMIETPHPQVHIISRLIEGEYPDYQGIIPKKYNLQLILEKDSFINQIKTASIFSGKSNEIKIRINNKKNGIDILSQTPDLGENKSFLPVKINPDAGEIKEIEISFNYRFLVEGLNNIKTKNILMELNGDDGPAVFKPEGDINYIYIVMPIKAS